MVWAISLMFTGLVGVLVRKAGASWALTLIVVGAYLLVVVVIATRSY